MIAIVCESGLARCLAASAEVAAVLAASEQLVELRRRRVVQVVAVAQPAATPLAQQALLAVRGEVGHQLALVV